MRGQPQLPSGPTSQQKDVVGESALLAGLQLKASDFKVYKVLGIGDKGVVFEAE